MYIETISEGERTCPCGCGQVFPTFSGVLRYSPERSVAFQAGHLKHCDSGPHLWLLLGSGPWFEDDARDCWLTLHLWVDGTEVKTSISDPSASPFWPGRSDADRYLTREEVLSREGGREWAIARRLDFEEHHKPTERFLNEPQGTGMASEQT